MKIELIYAPDCPNVEAARTALQQALQQTDSEIGWQEWNRLSDTTPDYARVHGSPTILVNGTAVSDAPNQDNSIGDSTAAHYRRKQPARDAHTGNCCRVYRNASGQLQGAPTVRQIVQALEDGLANP